MKAWMAEGESPIHLGQYVEFDLGEMFAGRKGRTGRSLPSYSFRNGSIRMAKKLFTESFCYAFDGNYIAAEEPLKKAISNHYSPELALILAVLQMKRHEFSQAIEGLKEAITFIENKLRKNQIDKKPPEYFELLIYLARALELNGKSSEAKASYYRVIEDGSCTDENILRIARQARPYRQKDLKKILMPYASYIPFR
jgi:tetratricopeptide (TPR) repeat protein